MTFREKVRYLDKSLSNNKGGRFPPPPPLQTGGLLVKTWKKEGKLISCGLGKYIKQAGVKIAKFCSQSHLFFCCRKCGLKHVSMANFFQHCLRSA